MQIWHKNSYLLLIWLNNNYLCRKIVSTMKRILVLGSLLLMTVLCAMPAHAQRFGAPETMKNKIVLGGDIGASYYGRHLYFSLAPQVGYRLTRNLEVGTRLGYSLNYYYDYGAYGSFFNHYFSGALYANYEIFAGIYAHVEDEEVCRLVSGPAITSASTQWYNSLLAGIGYRQYNSSRSFVFYSLLYDISYDYVTDDNPYISPFVVRVGACFALDGKKK